MSKENAFGVSLTYLPLQPIVTCQPNIPPLLAFPDLGALGHARNDAPQITDQATGPRCEDIRPPSYCRRNELVNDSP